MPRGMTGSRETDTPVTDCCPLPLPYCTSCECRYAPILLCLSFNELPQVTCSRSTSMKVTPPPCPGRWHRCLPVSKPPSRAPWASAKPRANWTHLEGVCASENTAQRRNGYHDAYGTHACDVHAHTKVNRRGTAPRDSGVVPCSAAQRTQLIEQLVLDPFRCEEWCSACSITNASG
jgi:hypothetical protein